MISFKKIVLGLALTVGCNLLANDEIDNVLQLCLQWMELQKEGQGLGNELLQLEQSQEIFLKAAVRREISDQEQAFDEAFRDIENKKNIVNEKIEKTAERLSLACSEMVDLTAFLEVAKNASDLVSKKNNIFWTEVNNAYLISEVKDDLLAAAKKAYQGYKTYYDVFFGLKQAREKVIYAEKVHRESLQHVKNSWLQAWTMFLEPGENINKEVLNISGVALEQVLKNNPCYRPVAFVLCFNHLASEAKILEKEIKITNELILGQERLKIQRPKRSRVQCKPFACPPVKKRKIA